MRARVAFKKRKVVHERFVWIVSVFDKPSDIMKYSKHTVHRLQAEIFGKKSKSDRSIIIREIIDKKPLTKSNLSLDEHKRQHSQEM